MSESDRGTSSGRTNEHNKCSSAALVVRVSPTVTRTILGGPQNGAGGRVNEHTCAASLHMCASERVRPWNEHLHKCSSAALVQVRVTSLAHIWGPPKCVLVPRSLTHSHLCSGAAQVLVRSLPHRFRVPRKRCQEGPLEGSRPTRVDTRNVTALLGSPQKCPCTQHLAENIAASLQYFLEKSGYGSRFSCEAIDHERVIFAKKAEKIAQKVVFSRNQRDLGPFFLKISHFWAKFEHFLPFFTNITLSVEVSFLFFSFLDPLSPKICPESTRARSRS